MRSHHLVLILLAVSAGTADAQVARRPFLFKDARAELAAARARGDVDVLMVIAAMEGRNQHVADLIRSVGGTIQFQADDVDYLRARVPVDRVEELVLHADVHSTDLATTGLTRTFGLADREGRSIGGSRVTQDPDRQWPPTWSDYPLTNRYSPLGDLNAIAFREANPTFDGRGVTLAMIDGNPDPLLPELQVATSLDGRRVPKIVAYETAIDATEEPDGRWIAMTDTVSTSGGAFTHDSIVYRTPHDGAFLFGIFDEAVKDSLANTGMDKDYNRDGNPDGSSRRFGVLWDMSTNDVWLDTDQDSSFADERPYTDYAVRPEFGTLGTDDPDTPIRESVAFGVQTDRANHRVALHFGVASHASLVVGAALASRGDAGRFDGVAPGAQLASISEGGSAYGQTEAVILAARHPSVDIIFLEQYSTITRDYVLRDGRLVPTVIYSRLIDRYGKVLVVPTHNYPVLGAPDDFVTARGAIGIGGHESKDNFFTNHGVRVEHDDNLLITGGYGPMGNGALAPDVISPSNYVSTARGFEDGRAIPGLFQLPPGYTIAGGTSTATPTAAGAIALLISGAKQTGVDYDPFRIKHAITTSARWVPHLPAYKQGNGVVNVAAAWEILQQMEAADSPIEIGVRAPVRTAWSGLLATPGEGVGLYEREGWAAGDRGERVVWLRRTGGPAGAMTFSLTWAGNTGTFSAPESVTLPPNTEVPVTIAIAPDTPGAHTAHLTLTHPDVPGFAHRMLATVVAAETLTADSNFAVTTEAKIPRPGMISFFYRVPEGVTALRFDLERPERPVTLTVVRPDTRNERGTREIPNTTDKATYVVTDPMPGMWEVRLTDIDDVRDWDWEQARKEEPVPPTPATLTVTALSAVVEGPDLIPFETWTGAVTQSLSVSNLMGSFTGNLVSTPMGSARRELRTIREGEQQMYEIDVLAGTTALVVRTGHTSDPAADLDVFVFDCTGDECKGARADGDLVGDESVIVRNPAAGTWKIVVDGSRIPSGGTSYEYTDVLLNPAYGTVGITDLPAEREPGGSWNADVHVWATTAAQDAGRFPFPLIAVNGKGSGADPYLVSLREAGTRVETDSPASRQ